MEPSRLRADDLLSSLPPEWPDEGLLARIREATIASGRKVVVLDDDPTGCQTVHDVPVVTEWSAEVLDAAWTEPGTTFYVLTNSRRFPLDEAVVLNRELAQDLALVAQERGTEPVVVSRSDSTLRGHYPGEVDALQDTLERELSITYDGVVIIPFFLEGGRLTAHDVHWVREGEWLTPAAQTEFAHDRSFGYAHSNLHRWVEEKTAGRVTADKVLSISLDTLRRGGPHAAADALQDVRGGRVIVVNAVSYRDLEVFVAGLLEAEQRGQRFLFRTAASFVKVRGGIPDRGLLTRAELYEEEPSGETGGLTLVGSYVQRTTQQLEQALQLPRTLAVGLSAAAVLDAETRAAEVRDVRDMVAKGLGEGQDVIAYTSRELLVPTGMTQLEASQQVSSALVEVLRGLETTPAYLIGKGGITSSDLATEALDVRRAQVLGQILPGVPVWRLGPESKYPGLPYVVFPGNVGGPEALARAMLVLRGDT